MHLCHMPQALQLLGLLVQDEEERSSGRLLVLPPEKEGEEARQALWSDWKITRVEQRGKESPRIQDDDVKARLTLPLARRG